MTTTLEQRLGRDHDVLVLGAGVVGMNSAYWLARRGRRVTVVERREGPALETSYANGGQISVCHAEPWANPRAPWQVLLWLLDRQAPLSFRPRWDRRQWLWLLQWLRECSPARCHENTAAIVDLALHSRRLLVEQREEHGLAYRQRCEGILHFYRQPKAFRAAESMSRYMRELGCDRQAIDRERVLAIEPALEAIGEDIVGGTYTAEDESGDAHLYTRELRRVCEDMGVQFVFDCEATALTPVAGGMAVQVQSSRGEEESLRASARDVVVALGVASNDLLQPLGRALNLYPAKGYSISVPVTADDTAPTVSLTDDEFKLVFSRLGDTLRVAGMAELRGYDNTIDPLRLRALVERVRGIFPDIAGYQQAEEWAGLRPSTPSNRPIIGPAGIDHLWLNLGHGSLGWTMSCGSGERLSRMMSAAS
ncbi:MAG: D-amino acid dehydrogenase [Pseudomonadota bacterium]